MKKAPQKLLPSADEGGSGFSGRLQLWLHLFSAHRDQAGSPKNFEEPDGSEKLGLERPQAEGRLAPAEAENASSASF